MKNKNVVIRLPKLYDAGGDTSKKWFVYFHVINPLTGKLERVRIQKDINKIADAEKRREAAYYLLHELKAKLMIGWNPLDVEANEDVVYSDSLAYKSVVSVTGGMKTSARNVGYYLSSYLDSIKPSLSTKSFESYQSKLRIFDLWLNAKGYEKYDISSISNSIILKFFDHLIKERDLASGTIDKYRRHLADFFRYLIKEKKASFNPVFEIPRTAKRVDMAPRPISQNYLDVLNEALATEPQLWLVTRLEYYCAIRPGEIRNLKIKDIDMIGQVIRVSSMWSKNGKSESVNMPRQIIEAINETYDLSKYDPEFYLIGRGREPGPEMVGKNTLRVRFNEIRKALNLPLEFKLYSFKHTAAVKLASTNMPVKQIQQHFRHSRLDTTDRYMQRMAAYATESMKNDFPDL